MGYTLDKFFEEAQVNPIPEWFSDVTLQHRKIEDFKPRWAQIEGLNLMFVYPNLRCGLWDEQGTGKTLPAQAFAIWQAAIGNKCVCLMPRTLLRQFQSNLSFTFPGVDKHIRCEIYHGTTKKRDKAVGKWTQEGAPEIVLTTYGVFMREFPLFNLFDYKSILMDEARILSNAESKTYTAIWKFMNTGESKYAVALNGTPSGNTPRDLFGVIDFITPGIYRSQEHFDTRHVIFKQVSVTVRGKRSLSEVTQRNVDVIEDYDNLEELAANLYLQARRVEKSSLGLPPLTEEEVPFDLGEEHKEAYDQFVTERMLEFTDGSILDGTTSSALRQTAFQAVMRPDLLGVAEESRLLELIEELSLGAGIEKDTKVFVMAHYQKTIELLKKRFAKWKPAVIYGKTRNPAREREKFLYDSDCRMLIVNYESGGVGLDGLQDVCHTGICAEPTTVPRAFAQARDRLHRGGQTDPVMIYMPKPRGTLYVKAIRNLQKKQEWIDRVVSTEDMAAELRGNDEEDNLN